MAFLVSYGPKGARGAAALDPADSLKLSLVGMWSLDEFGGAARVDSSGNGRNLTDNNTAGQLAGPGTFASGASFVTGSNQFLSHADDAAFSPGDADFSIATWAYLEDKATSYGIVSKENTTGATEEYAIWFDQVADRFKFTIGQHSLTATADTLGSPSTGTWYFIYAEHNAGADTISIAVNDGAADSTATSGNAPSDSTGAFELGRKAADNATSLNGRIGHTGMWDKVLTSGETAYLYNSGNGQDPYATAGALWTPTQLAGALALWLNAGSITGVSDGNDITTWPDDGDNSFTLTQGDSAKRPSYNASDSNFNSKPTVTFDGVDEFFQDLSVGANPFGSTGDLFLVLKLASTSGVKRLYQVNDGSLTRCTLFRSSGQWKFRPGTTNRIQGATTTSATILEWSGDGAGTLEQYIDNVKQADQTENDWHGDHTVTQITIGCKDEGTPSQFSDADWAEALWTDAQQSALNRSRIRNYLFNKYQIGVPV